MSFYSASNGKSSIMHSKSRCQPFSQKFLKLYLSLIFARVAHGEKNRPTRAYAYTIKSARAFIKFYNNIHHNE